MVNSIPVAGSPFAVTVNPPTIDVIDQACLVSHYVIGDPPELWTVGPLQNWSTSNSQPGATILQCPATQGSDTINITSNLPTADEWFTNGFLFTFDITIKCTSPVIFRPVQLPTSADLTMTWTPNASDPAGLGSSAWSLETWAGPASNKTNDKISHLTIEHTDQPATGPENPTTITVLYVLSPDKLNYSVFVFQAGQYITTVQWPKTDSQSMPKLDFSFQRKEVVETAIVVANVTTVPSYFRSDKTNAPESASDIVLSQSWASKTMVNQATDDWIYQQPPAAYGCSIAVYSLTVSKAYDFSAQMRQKLGESPIIAAILFGSPFMNSNTNRWADWDGNHETTQDIGPCNIKVDPNYTNIVVAIAGQGCVTVFSNGEFAFSVTKRFDQPIVGVPLPSILSWWTDITWHAMHMNPPMRLLHDAIGPPF
ncbi:hypothetical protein B7463_g12257, partial [Scytalidium lignicola]